MERDFIISIETDPIEEDEPLPTSLYNLYSLIEYDKKISLNPNGELVY